MTNKEVEKLTKTINQQKHEIERLITINNIIKVENDKLLKELKETTKEMLRLKAYEDLYKARKGDFE